MRIVGIALVGLILFSTARAEEEKPPLPKPTEVFTAANDLRDPPPSDRGATDMDLTDFLDEWFCGGNGNRGNATTGVEGNVVGIHQFPYDFAFQTACPSPPAGP